MKMQSGLLLQDGEANGVVMNTKTAIQPQWSPTSTTLNSWNTFNSGTRWAKSEFRINLDGTYSYRLSQDYNAGSWFLEGQWLATTGNSSTSTYEVSVYTAVGSLTENPSGTGYIPVTGGQIWSITNTVLDSAKLTGCSFTIREIGVPVNVTSPPMTVTFKANIGTGHPV